jgi:hypothetical protein
MRLTRPFALLFLGAVASGASTAAFAQCPDGTPPPCRAAATAARRDPPLDERTWLILPFENTSRSADADVLRQAGLSLLYQELARWSDVRVISDDRVNDLIRALPEAQRSPLGLEAARTLARRVGAGRVVIGDYVALGPSAQIAAKIYDAGTGRQVRIARERLTGFSAATGLDSMSATYSRLGAAILGLPPRREAGSLAGTTSMQAFREYIDGLAALNRVDLPAATARFRGAVQADSNFALAWLRLTQITFDTLLSRTYAAAAERNAGTLPARERAKLAVLLALRRPPGEACDPAGRLLALDSGDADGWIGMARCELRPRSEPLQPYPGDTSRRTLPLNFNRAVDAARRAVRAEPTSMFANLTLYNTLRTTSFEPLCERVGPGGACPLDSLWTGAMLAAGDSAVLPLERWSVARGDPPALRPAAVAFRRSRHEEMRRIADAWLLLVPGTLGGRLMRANMHYELGVPEEAARIADSLPTYIGPNAGFVGHEFRLQLDLTLRRDGIPGRVDSLYASPESTAVQGQLYSMVGKFRADAARVPAQRAARESWLPVVAGVLPANFDSVTTALAALQSGPINSAHVFEMSTLIAFRMRGTGPALDTAAVHPIRRVQAFLARGDTARARRELAGFDAILSRRAPLTHDDGGWMFAAESYLQLGDTARALALMTDWAGRWGATPKPLTARIMDQNFFFALPRLYGRMWLLTADLAMAAGRTALARQAYRMVVNLWQQGDAPVQPMVARARQALVRLGN